MVWQLLQLFHLSSKGRYLYCGKRWGKVQKWKRLSPNMDVQNLPRRQRWQCSNLKGGSSEWLLVNLTCGFAVFKNILPLDIRPAIQDKMIHQPTTWSLGQFFYPSIPWRRSHLCKRDFQRIWKWMLNRLKYKVSYYEIKSDMTKM